MIPKLVIEKALDGGWRPKAPDYPKQKMKLDPSGMFFTGEVFKKTTYQIALDPSFWIALGKALRWCDGLHGNSEHDKECNGWGVQAHRFYDLVLNGQPTDDFWDQLLK